MARTQPSAAALVRHVRRSWERYAVAALLSLYAAQVLYGITSIGATFDENVHLAAGYSYWAFGDFRMNSEHPPIAKLLAGLPLYVRGLRASQQWPEWQHADGQAFAKRLLYVDNDATPLLFMGRIPVLLLSCVLGFFVYHWARAVSGRAGGLFALAMFALTPDFLAHGGLVTTDAPLSAWLFIAWYALTRCLERVTLMRLVCVGLALGTALATKFSALVLLPLFVVLPAVRACWPAPLVVQWTRRSPERALSRARERAAVLAPAVLAFCVLCLVVIWASYGFRGATPIGADGPAFAWQRMRDVPPFVRSAISLLRAWHALPDPYVYGLLSAYGDAQHRVSFLLGQISSSGFAYYFVVTFLVKTPLPEIGLMVVGGALAVIGVARRSVQPGYLLLPPLVYFAVALNTHLNIGQRHILPIYPCLIVLAGSAAAELTKRRSTAFAAFVLYVWLAKGTLSIAPSYLAYFNELAGGPRAGMQIVVDSNLDWGQDLPGLKRWMDAHHVPRVYLSYFGSSLPGYYGIDYLALPSFYPLPPRAAGRLPPARETYVVVSATNLQKVYLTGVAPREFLRFIDHLRDDCTPLDVIGGSLYVYRTPCGSATQPSAQ